MAEKSIPKIIDVSLVVYEWEKIDGVLHKDKPAIGSTLHLHSSQSVHGKIILQISQGCW